MTAVGDSEPLVIARKLRQCLQIVKEETWCNPVSLLDIRHLEAYASRLASDTVFRTLESNLCPELHRRPSTSGSHARPRSVTAPSARAFALR